MRPIQIRKKQTSKNPFSNTDSSITPTTNYWHPIEQFDVSIFLSPYPKQFDVEHQLFDCTHWSDIQ